MPRGRKKAKVENDSGTVAYMPESPVEEQKPSFELPTAPAPRGSQWVWNRLPTLYTIQFDLEEEVWEPYEVRLWPVDMARWFVSHSVIQLDIGTGVEVHALVTPWEKKEWGVPIEPRTSPELVDRSRDDNPYGWSTEGAPTRVEYRKV